MTGTLTEKLNTWYQNNVFKVVAGLGLAFGAAINLMEPINQPSLSDYLINSSVPSIITMLAFTAGSEKLKYGLKAGCVMYGSSLIGQAITEGIKYVSN